MKRREKNHAMRSRDAKNACFSGLTRNQARSIEQYCIEIGRTNGQKQIDSISKNSPHYQFAIAWAKAHLAAHGIDVNSIQNMKGRNDMNNKNTSEHYVKTVKYENRVAVCFYLEHAKPLAIGEKMNEINSEAYMNGYNWEALLNYYLKKYDRDVLKGMESDPEAGMYVASYKLTHGNEARAERFLEIITSLVENEDELYRIVREENIDWD